MNQRAESFTLITGPRASGKTIYMTHLIHQYLRNPWQEVHCYTDMHLSFPQTWLTGPLAKPVSNILEDSLSNLSLETENRISLPERVPLNRRIHPIFFLPPSLLTCSREDWKYVLPRNSLVAIDEIHLHISRHAPTQEMVNELFAFLLEEANNNIIATTQFPLNSLPEGIRRLINKVIGVECDGDIIMARDSYIIYAPDYSGFLTERMGRPVWQEGLDKPAF